MTSEGALRAAEDRDFGCVWINDHLPFSSQMPHGGFGSPARARTFAATPQGGNTRVKHVMASLR